MSTAAGAPQTELYSMSTADWALHNTADWALHNTADWALNIENFTMSTAD